jgi:hypothetical protein
MRRCAEWNGWTTALPAVLSLALLAGCESTGPRQVAGPDLISLFNGYELAGWKAMNPAQNAWQTASQVRVDAEDPKKFDLIPGSGILVNGPVGKTTNIYSELEHGDCEAHVEFMVPKDSNSGVYFQGRYEIQILDSFGKDEVTFSDCCGIYSRWIENTNVEGHAPRVNASRPPGEWQSFDVRFIAPRFDEQGKKIANARFDWVRHNGVLVHQNVELNGPTRAAMDENKEVPTGPIMLQGDHGPVAYRNMSIRLLK